ncbi:MAG TPA: hypothetical protein DEP72_07155 [Clostridiales bacterium]|nr:MAG: hypothetical protein A2Y18_00535 [Clostridiales bacterium GWD2_32_19]HCC07913.1 hypothetical protein [Clostridiales bacterium]
MDIFLDIVFRLDEYLSMIAHDYGIYAYIIIFITIFCETGLVITPFLPGDSLVFLTGVLAAKGDLDLWVIFFMIPTAAVVGDNVNYRIGYLLRHKIARNEKITFIKKEHLEKTNKFFEKHGGKTIIIARFVPIVRTFTPFVSGVAQMPYLRFLLYSIAGAFIWVTTFLFAGYFLGEIPFFMEYFSLIIVAILLLSFTPIMIIVLKKLFKI